jgi:branched-chain amino acid transport system permease protein
VSLYVYFAVLGLSAGAIYVGLGAGLLTVYRATGIINFAQGAIAMWGAYVYVNLRATGNLVFPVGSVHLGSHVPLAVDVLLGVVFAILAGLLGHLLVFRAMRSAPALARVVASVALMLSFQALATLRFSGNQVNVPSVLPAWTVKVGTYALPDSDLIVAGIAIAAAVLLWWWFRATNLGTATRAAAMNPRGASLLGYSPSSISAIAWSVAAALSGFMVMLASTATGLNPTTYTLDVVPALAVLLLARLSSLALVTISGLALGVFQAVTTYLMSQPWWPTWAQSGVQDAIPFVIIVIVLFAFGGRIVSRGSLDSASLPSVRLPRLTMKGLTSALVVGAVALIVTHGTYRFGVETSMMLAIVALSYVIITGYIGQISLAQISFAGAAGFALSKFTTTWHVPFPFSVLLSAAVATALGLLMAIPAFRIRGAQLAIVTIAAAVAIQEFVFSNPSLTSVSGNPIGTPTFLGLDLSVRNGADISTLSFGFLVLVIAALVALLYVVLARGQTGRAFLAVRSNERAAAAAGLNVSAVKLVAFGLSAFIAGIAGCLIGFSRGQLSADSFTVFVGLDMLAVAYLGGITSLSGAVLAGILGPLGILYVVLNSSFNLGQYYQLVAGLGLLLTAILNQEGIAGEMHRNWERLRLARSKRRDGLAPPAASSAIAQTTEVTHAE